MVLLALFIVGFSVSGSAEKILPSPDAGCIVIAEILGMFITLIAAVTLSVLPAVLFQVLTLNLWGLLFLGIYIVMAVPTVYYRLTGIKLLRR